MSEEKKDKSTNYTEVIIALLWVIYVLQFVFFEQFGTMFATSPNHLFTSDFYTIVTAIFFHGSLLHLLSNSIALFIFGRILEKHIGSQIVLVFLLGGVFANIISHLFSFYLGDIFSSWGASGAIATIILLSILSEPFHRVLYVIPIFVLGWISIYGDISGLVRDDTINQFAHLGGYLGSFLLLFLIEKSKLDKIKKGFLINIILLVSLALVIYLL